MKLSKDDLKKLSVVAIGAAKEAGQMIREHASKGVKVSKKETGETLAAQVVTEVDLKSQDIILEHIRHTLEPYDLGLLCEEDADDGSRFEKDYFWSIDPMDGTLQFVESRKGYAVSIGLVTRDGESVIGVAYDPFEQTLYHAVKGGGVFRNEKPWILKSDQSNKETELIEGGAVMNACWVIEQAPAFFYKKPKKRDGGGSVWDYAATVCIYQELGAWVSDMYGKPLELNRKGSLFMNQKGVVFASDEVVAKQIMIGESDA